MAANFTVVNQYPGIDTYGGTTSYDVIFVGINTVPDGTYFEFPVLRSEYNAGFVRVQATDFASAIEGVWAEDFVAGVQWTQEVNVSNQLVSTIIITVTSTSGNSAATLSVPFSQLGAKLHAPQVAALHTELDDAEAL